MHSEEHRKLISIIPAEGWYARYKMSDGTYEDGRLAAWGHYHDEADQDDYLSYSVGGLIPTEGGYLDWADESSNFDRFAYLGSETKQWIHPARVEG